MSEGSGRLSVGASRKMAIVLFCALFAAVVLGGWLRWQSQPANQLRTAEGVMLYSSGRPVADFRFIDQHGAVRTRENLGKGWKLVFFGYTFCPDICPTTLADMNRVWKRLTPASRDQFQLLFVSVDPARDTPRALQPYLEYFNPAFIGLTGDSHSLEQLAADINGFYARVDRDDRPYLMDHSANMMLIDHNWQYRGYIEPPFQTERMRAILEALGQLRQ